MENKNIDIVFFYILQSLLFKYISNIPTGILYCPIFKYIPIYKRSEHPSPKHFYILTTVYDILIKKFIIANISKYESKKK